MQQNQDDWLKYDELEAVKYIRAYLPKEVSKKLSDDDIDEVIDMMYDYYEEKGILEEEIDMENSDEEVEIDVDELLSYIYIRPDRALLKNLSDEEIELIVQGELNYCDSLSMQE